MADVRQIFIFDKRKNFTPIISKSGDIAIQSEKIFFFKFDGPTLGTPQGTAFHTIFSGKDILRRQCRQLSRVS